MCTKWFFLINYFVLFLVESKVLIEKTNENGKNLVAKISICGWNYLDEESKLNRNLSKQGMEFKWNVMK